MQDRPYIVCAAGLESGGLADAIVGVGKAAAAMHTTRLLLAGRPAWVLLIGVCGAYAGAGLAVGELCLVGEDRLADEGVALADGGFLALAEWGHGNAGPFAGDPLRTADAARRLGAPAGARIVAAEGRAGKRVEHSCRI